jgi:CO dehydrogenase maturation factor
MNGPGPFTGKRIGFCGKGGSGKSTVTVLLAKALRERGHEVCVLDADSSNRGLDRALDAAQDPRPLLDHFGGMVFSGGSVTCPVDDPSPLLGGEVDLEGLSPAFRARSPSGIVLLVAGKVGSLGSGSGCDGPIAKIARDLRIRSGGDDVLTLVDFKAGLEDPARGVITGLDWALTVVEPSLASIRLAGEMQNMVRWLKAGRPPAVSHLESPELVSLALKTYSRARIDRVFVVLNRIRDRQTEELVRARLADHGVTPIGVLHEDPEISRSWLEGSPLTASRAWEDAQRLAITLEKRAAIGRGAMARV